MATFTNYATLSYNGNTIVSNTVTGEILETIAATKTAVRDTYSPGDDITYVVTLVNTGPAAVTGLTVTDDMGGYLFDENTVYPLAYGEGSIRYYINGVLQPAPTVEAGPPMTVSGISVPAGGNVVLVYEAEVTGYAPAAAESSILNTVTVTGGGLTQPVTAQETVFTLDQPSLTVSKLLAPSSVVENGQLTYTFVIENTGNTEAVATEDLILTDVFNPILDPITVTYNGQTWTEGVNYTYDETTGTFATLPSQISVPAATYTQNTDGTWVTSPGSTVITVTGTV